MKKATILCVLFIGFQSFTYSQAWQKFTNKDFGVSAELPGKFDVKIKNFKERKNLSAVHNGKDYVLFSVSEYDEKINENLAVDLIASSMQEGDEVVQSAKDWKHNGKKWTSAILKSLAVGGYVHVRVLIRGKLVYNMRYISYSPNPKGNVDRFFNSIQI